MLLINANCAINIAIIFCLSLPALASDTTTSTFYISTNEVGKDDIPARLGHKLFDMYDIRTVRLFVSDYFSICFGYDNSTKKDVIAISIVGRKSDNIGGKLLSLKLKIIEDTYDHDEITKNEKYRAKFVEDLKNKYSDFIEQRPSYMCFPWQSDPDVGIARRILDQIYYNKPEEVEKILRDISIEKTMEYLTWDIVDDDDLFKYTKFHADDTMMHLAAKNVDILQVIYNKVEKENFIELMSNSNNGRKKLPIFANDIDSEKGQQNILLILRSFAHDIDLLLAIAEPLKGRFLTGQHACYRCFSSEPDEDMYIKMELLDKIYSNNQREVEAILNDLSVETTMKYLSLNILDKFEGEFTDDILRQYIMFNSDYTMMHIAARSLELLEVIYNKVGQLNFIKLICNDKNRDKKPPIFANNIYSKEGRAKIVKIIVMFNDPSNMSINMFLARYKNRSLASYLNKYGH